MMSSNIPSISDFNLLQLIGKSSFSPTAIYLAKHQKSEKLKAIRATNLESCSSLCFTFIQHELLVSQNFKHPNIQIHESVFVNARTLYVVTKMMSFGSCLDLIEAQFKYGLKEIVISYILREVLKALEYIHQLGFIHRNVKAGHILVSDDGSVKLAGHRNSITFLDKNYRPRKVFDYPKHDVMLLPWLSPEILKQNMAGYCSQSDIYSIGITACELANGHAPFTDMPATKMLYEKLNGTVPCLLDETTVPAPEDGIDKNEHQIASRSRKFSDAFHKFVFACLHLDPSSRPTTTQALGDPFFSQIPAPGGEFDLKPHLLPLVPMTSLVTQDKDSINAVSDLQHEVTTPKEISWDFPEEEN